MQLLKTFLYFAIFKHPLTKEEALNFCQYPSQNIDAELEALVSKNLLFKIGDFYLPVDDKSWVERRLKGNQMAEKKMKTARKMASFISSFPLVRSVMISGSLSKGYMDNDSDIDFFVIMAPGNILITKAMLGTFRRLFAPKSLCVNYVISEENLSIKKRSIYTAIEMATLIPMNDSQDLFKRFMNKNLSWVKEILPNFTVCSTDIRPIKQNSMKRIFEWLVSTKIASFFNDKLNGFYAKKALQSKVKNDTSNHENSKYEEYTVNRGVIKIHDKAYHTMVMQKYTEYSQVLDAGKELVFNQYIYD